MSDEDLWFFRYLMYAPAALGAGWLLGSVILPYFFPRWGG
jgi:hypothetical protein